MGRKLAVIAILGIGVSVVCMGAAAAIGGSILGSMDFLPFGDRPHCKIIAGATATSRTLAWDGSDHVGFALLGHARYRPGTDDSVHVTGDPQVLAHLKLKDGTIQLDCKSWGWGWGERPSTKDVEVTLPGRIFKRFEIAGPGEVRLHTNPKRLDSEIAGPGRIRNLAD